MHFMRRSSARRPPTAEPTSRETLDRPLVVADCCLIASSAAAKAVSRAISPRSIAAVTYLKVHTEGSRNLEFCKQISANGCPLHHFIELLNPINAQCK